jgi:putative MATE family efflux protein
LGSAAAALVARAGGAGDRETARRRATNSLIYGLVAGALVAAALWPALAPVAALLGATGRTLALTVHYLRIVVPSLPLLILGMVGGAILRAHGDARRSMTATLGGAAVSAVLDPILILGLGLDLTGAAISTVCARVAIGALALLPLLRHYGGFGRPTPATVRLDLGPVLAIALPAVATQLATPLGQAWVTRAMADFGEAAVAGLAIVSRLTPVAFGVIFALSGAVGPIVGQNAGARRGDRVRETFRAALLFTAIVTVAVSLALYLLRPALARLFALDGLTGEIVFLFAGPLSLLFFFNGVIFVSNAACNNLGRPLWSTLINWGRNTLGTIPLVIAGAAWFGAPGVLIGQAAGGVIFGLLAWWLALRVIARRGGA